MLATPPDKPADFYLKHDIAMYENAKWTEEHLGKPLYGDIMDTFRKQICCLLYTLK